MTFGAKWLLIFVCIAFLGIVIGVNTGMDSTLGAYLIVFGGGFGSCGLATLWDNKEKSAKVQYYTYDKATYTLTLIERNYSAFSKAIKVEPHRTVSYKYNPAELEYNGVTVGGVTTGGFHVNPASYSPSSMEKSGKYQLVLMPGYNVIKNIILPTGLVAVAKNNRTLEKFLKKDRLELKYTGGDAEMTEYERSIMSHNMTSRPDLFYNAANRALAAQALTKEDCEAIKYWLCGQE